MTNSKPSGGYEESVLSLVSIVAPKFQYIVPDFLMASGYVSAM